MRSLMRSVALGLGALTLALTVGCGEKMMRFNVDVQLQNLDGQTVVVDLAGVAPGSVVNWDAKDGNDYWNPGDTFRSDNQKFIHTMSFPARDPNRRATLSASNPIWSTWSAIDARQLYIMADLPQGPARNTVSLGSEDWESTPRTVSVRVTSSGVFVDEAFGGG